MEAWTGAVSYDEAASKHRIYSRMIAVILISGKEPRRGEANTSSLYLLDERENQGRIPGIIAIGTQFRRFRAWSLVSLI